MALRRLYGSWPEEHLPILSVAAVPDAVWVQQADNFIQCPTAQVPQFIEMLLQASEEADNVSVEFPVPSLAFGVQDVHEMGLLIDRAVLIGLVTPRMEALFEDVDAFLNEHVGADWHDRFPE